MSLQTDLQLERLRRTLRVRDHWRLQAEPTIVPVLDVSHHIQRELELPPTFVVSNANQLLTGPANFAVADYAIPPDSEAEIVSVQYAAVRRTAPTTPGVITFRLRIVLPIGSVEVIRHMELLPNVNSSMNVREFNNNPVGQRIQPGADILCSFHDTSDGGTVESWASLLIKVHRL